VRIGIHTGPVVVGEMGGGGRHENLGTGETVNIASRLEGVTAPNTVVISSVTARLVERLFALEDLGPHALKGVAEPMPVFRVLTPMAGHDDEPVAAGLPFLVGQDEELGLLARRWGQSKAGLGQVVLISGTAGIGKSSLVEMLRARVRGEGLPRIAFRCSSYHTNSALYPVITHVERLLTLQREDAPATKLDKLEQGLRPYSQPLEEVVPLFASLLSVPLNARYPALTLTPQQQKQHTLDALITHLSRSKALPSEVVEHIVTKTDGVPLYVEELTKMLLKSELIREEPEPYVLTGPLVSVAIPDTLQGSLMARLDQMHTAKEVAQLGSVLGRAFSYEMLQAIASQDDETVQASLAQLVGAELLYQRGRPPCARYMFKHALIQDAAYASLLKSVRQRVYQQIARLLETRFPEVVDTQPELVAHHFTEAGGDDDAIRYWQQAGQHALQRSANAEAIAHLAKGVAVLTTRPETPARLHQELDLQVALGTALYATKGNAAPEVERVYTRARELCEQLGDTQHLFPVLRGLINHYMTRGRLQTASQLAEQLLRLARSQHEPAYLLLAYHMLGIVLCFRGELVSAYTHHKQVLAIYNPQEHRALAVRYGLDLGVAAGSWLPWELWQLGYPDQAMQHSQAARILAWEVSHLFSLTLALVFAAFLHQHRRETLAVHEQAEAAITLATEEGFAFWLACGTVLHGWARAIQ
jgi:tetratricopeptide (TPR) repeat protein